MNVKNTLQILEIREYAIYKMRMCFALLFNMIHIPDIGKIEEKFRFLTLDVKDCEVIKQYNISTCVTNDENSKSDIYIKNFIEAIDAVCLKVNTSNLTVVDITSYYILFICSFALLCSFIIYIVRVRIFNL